MAEPRAGSLTSPPRLHCGHLASGGGIPIGNAMSARGFACVCGAILATLALSGCVSGTHFAPVDEVGPERQGEPAATAVGVSGSRTPAASSPPSSGVTVTTLPYGGGDGAARPLASGDADAQPQGIVPVPSDTSVASVAPATAAPAPALAPTPATLSPAVVALVKDADQRASAGQHDRAAASLERALQVEPSNAWLWHRLARERFAQGRNAEAESLAGRSNSLAVGDAGLQAGNWRLIEQARRRRGDPAGAAEAARRVSALQTG